MNGFGVGFGPSPEVLAQREAERVVAAEAARAQQEATKQRKRAKKKEERVRLKTNDPELCAFSRELRDRWQEAVEQRPGLIESAARPRYEVGRLIAPPTPAPGSNPSPGSINPAPASGEMPRADLPGVKVVEARRLAA